TPGPAPPRAVHRARRYAMAQAAAPVGWHKCAVRGAAPARLPAQLRQFWPTPSTYRPRPAPFAPEVRWSRAGYPAWAGLAPGRRPTPGAPAPPERAWTACDATLRQTTSCRAAQQ